MSYILDALRKAEEERSLGQIPQAKTVYESLPARQPRHWTKILLGLLLLSNGAALTALFLATDYGKAILSSDLTMSTASQAVKTIPADTSVTLRAAQTDAQSQPQDNTAAIGKTSPSLKSERNVTPSLKVFSPPASDNEQTLPLEAFSPRSNTATSIEATQLANTTTASTSSWQNPQPSIPHLNLNIHVYDQTQQKSFVVINSVRYREGEQLKEGPNLELITEDGVVLSYAGQRFRLQVGE